MRLRTAPRLLALLALVLVAGQARPAQATLLLGSSVTGSLQFGSNPTNFFDPANGFVPVGPLNKTSGITVVIADPAVEFGFLDGANDDTANFTDTTLTITDVAMTVAGGNSSTYTFTSAAFAGLTVTKTSDSYVNGGVSFSLVGNTLTVNAPAFGNLATSNVLSASFSFAQASAVPEPSTVASLGIAGLLGLAARFRRRLLVLG